MKFSAKPFLLYSLVIILSFFSFNCATIVSRTRYPLFINTEPKGVFVVVTDKRGRQIYSGTTPTTVTLQAGGGFFTPARYYVNLKMTGYKEKSIPVHFTLDGWYLGNIMIGGALGMLIIDPLTGAMWKIKDPVVDEEMESLSASTGAILKIMNLSDIPDTLRSNLVRLKI